MSTGATPPLPAGYALDQPGTPALPAGYTLDEPQASTAQVAPLNAQQMANVQRALPGATPVLLQAIAANPGRYAHLLPPGTLTETNTLPPAAAPSFLGETGNILLKQAEGVIGSAAAPITAGYQGYERARAGGSGVLSSLGTGALESAFAAPVAPAISSVEAARRVPERYQANAPVIGKPLAALYAGAAPFLASAVGVDLPEMESQAAQGHTAAVAANAAVPIGELAAGEGVNVIREARAAPLPDNVSVADANIIADARAKVAERTKNEPTPQSAAMSQTQAPTTSTVNVSPDSFIRKVSDKGSHVSSQAVEDYRNQIRSGQPIQPLKLELDADGNVIGADGRHRALAAKLEGVDQVPVQVTRPQPATPASVTFLPTTASGPVPVPGTAAATTTPVNPISTSGALNTASQFLSPIDPYSAITRAVKPGTNVVGWDAALHLALPDILEAEKTVAPVTDLQSLSQTIGAAKKNVWGEYQQMLGSNAGVTIDGANIADAMKGSIDSRFRLQHPEAAAALDKVADTYNGPEPFTVQNAEDFLQSANNELHGYYAKNKVGRNVAAGDPAISSTLAEADALRSALYDKLDDLTGGDSAAIKKRYGALSTLEEPTLKRQNVWARQQPDSLQEQLNMAQGAARVGAAALNLAPGDTVIGLGQMAVSRMLKDRGNSDLLVKNAFNSLRGGGNSSVGSTTFRGLPINPLAVPLIAASGLRYNPANGQN
ncbi:MAG: hypothetical protein ACRD2O_00115 [Terriglobia bacterium]